MAIKSNESHNYYDENRDEIEIYQGVVTGASNGSQHQGPVSI